MKRTLQIGVALIALAVCSPLRGGEPTEPPVTSTQIDPESDKEAIMAVIEAQHRAFRERSYEGEAAVWANED